jgi:hypothetical protein
MAVGRIALVGDAAFIPRPHTEASTGLVTPSPSHAVAGAARNRAMSIRISANISRDTATSAIWNVT